MIDPVTIGVIAIVFFTAFLLAVTLAPALEDNHDELFNRLIEELQGSASIPTEEQRLIIERDPDRFDAALFNCDQCGWWCSTDELNNLEGDQHCDDCILDSERG